MIDLLRAEWTKLRTVRGWVFGIAIVVSLVVAASIIVAGLAIGAIAVPIHEHILQANDTVFYPISTELGPHVDAGTLTLFAATAFLLVLGLFFLCAWTAFTVMLAGLLVHRREA
jgi:hypothetical protein